MLPRPIRIVLFVIACGIILWLSLAPSDAIPQVSLWDKIKHASAYLVLTVVAGYAFPNRLRWVVIVLFCFGVGVEVLQANMDLGRDGDALDALANSIGIAVGILLTFAIREAIKVKSRARGE